MARRLAAILAADVVGYSRLMAADEKGTHARLKALRQDFIEPKIAEHHGRVAKLMGDGALVEFASVVDAVECAAAIQKGVAERQAELPEDQRIALRIGINIGDVIIEGDDIYGDGVNVAARLEALAKPGEICVSRTVYTHAKAKVGFGFAPMGEHRVKNIPEPVTVYRVITDPGPVARTLSLKHAGMRRGHLTALAAAAVVLLVAAAGAGLWLRSDDSATVAQQAATAVSTTGAPGGTAQAPSDKYRIAVLPFVNMSGEVENEYFSDGITEELITEVSKIGELSVIARTSVMKYKGADKSIAAIGRELQVGTILEGSVRKAENHVRIAAQLIDVASETHLWAEDYDREMAGIFAIQSDIAEEVARNLKITLLGTEQKRIEAPDTQNIEAYNLYLKAHYLFNQQSSDSVLRSVQLLKQAIALDPKYAAAYAALADFSNSLIWFSDISPAEAHGQAKEYAQKALALDPNLARAYGALASAEMYGELDWEGAELAFKRALELNPSSARVHQHYGHFFLLAAQRRDDEALAELTRALELDPLSDGVMNSLAWVRYHRREYPQAIALFREARELALGDPWNYVGIGQSLIFTGQPDQGLAEIRKALEISPDYDFLLCYLAWGYGVAGKLDEARRVVEQLKQNAQAKTISPMAFAWAYTGMGLKDEAIDWLEKAYAERDGAVIMLRVPEFYDVLSSEPRYHALLKKMRLES